MKAIQLLAMFTAGRLVCAASCVAVLCACRVVDSSGEKVKRGKFATTFFREYLKTRPEWNGKDLAACGGSQGGLQASWAAALVKGVSEVRLEVPWCCDLGGREVCR